MRFLRVLHFGYNTYTQTNSFRGDKASLINHTVLHKRFLRNKLFKLINNKHGIPLIALIKMLNRYFAVGTQPEYWTNVYKIFKTVAMHMFDIGNIKKNQIFLNILKS